MAAVRSVIASAMASGSMLDVTGSTSAKTGMQPHRMMGATEPMSLTGVTITSLPGSGLMAPRATWMAAVPLVLGTTSVTPKRSAYLRTNS